MNIEEYAKQLFLCNFSATIIFFVNFMERIISGRAKQTNNKCSTKDLIYLKL